MTDRVIRPKWLEKYKRWQVKISIDGKQRTFSSSIPGRKGEQECARKARMADSGIVAPSTRVSKLYDGFMNDLTARTGKANCVKTESIWRNWIAPHIDHCQIGRLTEQNMQDVLNFAGNAGKSRKYISCIRGVFTSFLRYARKCNATTLRADDLAIPNNAPVGERKIFSKSDIEVLFSSDATTFRGKPCTEFYIHAFRFLVLSGLRPSELCALERRQQKKPDMLNVHGAYNRYHERTRGKSENAARVFVLPDLAARELREQANMLKNMGIVSKYLFPDENGDQIDPLILYRRLKVYEQVNNISSISLYELRHTFISMCKGVIPEPLIQPVVGHSSTMPSYRTYGHALSGELEVVANMVDNVYSDILNQN